MAETPKVFCASVATLAVALENLTYDTADKVHPGEVVCLAGKAIQVFDYSVIWNYLNSSQYENLKSCFRRIGYRVHLDIRVLAGRSVEDFLKEGNEHGIFVKRGLFEVLVSVTSTDPDRH